MPEKNKRKCLKCGSSSLDPGVVLYRFPKPGVRNGLRCELWAKYCFPERSWSSEEFQAKLYSEHRMLCHKHFTHSSYIDFSKKKLHRHAAPNAECDEPISNIDNSAVAAPEPLQEILLDNTNIQEYSTFEEDEEEPDDQSFEMGLKLYAVSDGPPSLSVRQTLAALDVPFQLISVDFGKGDHMTEDYAKMNPQKEIPVLDDDGFFLSESNAIMQYICDKYRPGTPLYPLDPKARAIINQRLCFNLASYYANISAYTMAPIFFDYERTPLGLKKVHIALDVFNTYLTRLGTAYAAGDHLTIADFQLINTNMTLEAIDFDFYEYTKVQKWYDNFKKNHPELWMISAEAMKEIQHFAAHPPDLSHMDHPIHPIRKI